MRARRPRSTERASNESNRGHAGETPAVHRARVQRLEPHWAGETPAVHRRIHDRTKTPVGFVSYQSRYRSRRSALSATTTVLPSCRTTAQATVVMPRIPSGMSTPTTPIEMITF